MFSLPCLQVLDISGNQITRISRSILNLFNLKHLNISHNYIESFPLFLGQLPLLSLLLCDNNPFRNLPKEITGASSKTMILYLQAHSSIPEQLSTPSSASDAEDVVPLELSPFFKRIRSIQNTDSFYSPLLPPHSEIEMSEILSVFAFASGSTKHVLLGPKHRESLDVDRLVQRIAGVFYGAAIGDAACIGSETMSLDEVQFHYPQYTEYVMLETNFKSISEKENCPLQVENTTYHKIEKTSSLEGEKEFSQIGQSSTTIPTLPSEEGKPTPSVVGKTTCENETTSPSCCQESLKESASSLDPLAVSSSSFMLHRSVQFNEFIHDRHRSGVSF